MISCPEAECKVNSDIGDAYLGFIQDFIKKLIANAEEVGSL
jgi:hypothetical protein